MAVVVEVPATAWTTPVDDLGPGRPADLRASLPRRDVNGPRAVRDEEATPAPPGAGSAPGAAEPIHADPPTGAGKTEDNDLPAAVGGPDASGPIGTDPPAGPTDVDPLEEPGAEEPDADEPLPPGPPGGSSFLTPRTDFASPRPDRIEVEPVPVAGGHVLPAGPPFAPAAVPAHVVNAFDRLTGIDLGHVPLHREPEVAATAGTARARAYTRGGAVHLPAEAGPLDSPAVEALLGHELAHVAQQRALADVPVGGGEAHRLEAQALAVERTMRGVPEPIAAFDRPPSPDPAPAPAGLSWTPATGFTRAPAPAGAPAPATAVTQYASRDDTPAPDPGTTAAGFAAPSLVADPVDVLPLLAELRADLRADLQAALQEVGLQDAGEPAVVSSVPGWDEPAEPVTAPVESPPAVTDSTAAPEFAPPAEDVAGPGTDAAPPCTGVTAASLARVLTDLTEEMHATFIPSDDEGALDRLAAQLYERLSTRLRGDLLVDRERRGLLVDLP